MRRTALDFGWIVLAGLAAAASAAETSPAADPVYQALRKAELTGGSLSVRGLTLRRDALELSLEEGTLHLAAPVQGRTWLGVFLGRGRARLTPATAVEREHLRLVNDSPALEDELESAVLVWTDQTGEEIGAAQAQPGPAPGSAEGKARQLRKFLREELGVELEPRLLQDLYGPAGPGLFLARIEGRRYSRLLYVLDQRGAAPSWMAPEESGLYNAAEREGGWWYLAHMRSEVEAGAERHEPRAGFEALHYDLDTSIDKGERLRSTARIALRAREAGQRVVRFELDGRLRVGSAVRLTERAPLAWVQADEDEAFGVTVVLPEPPAQGQELQIDLAYEGKGVVEQLDAGVFYVGSRTDWYPSLGVFQQYAHYTLRFCVPERYELVAIGRRGGSEKRDGRECSTWTSEAPLAVAGFNYGQFKKHEQKDADTGLTLEVYTNPGRPRAGAEGALVDAVNSARVYSTYFGPLPYSRVAVTQQPAGWFGQAWPTLVYLPYTALLGGPTRVRGGGLRLDSMRDFRQTVGPHEMAHQWWGHAVGWRTYRDQWLSEGFAEYSSGLWLEVTEGPKRAHTFWQDARKAIVARTIFGQFPYQAGPLTLGYRLSTFQNRGAAGLIYNKGAFVLHMLRMMMQAPRGQDEAFIAMMKDFVKSFRNRPASTADFQAVVERHMTPEMDLEQNGRMDWFFRQWVEGTEVPEAYELEVRTEPAGEGKLRLSGGLRQTGVSEGFRMLVPIYLELDGDRLVRVGRVRCVGTGRVPLDVVLPVAKVRKVRVNAQLDVLTRQ
jgi:hypothetical protein